MVVDSSAIVAILRGEADAPLYGRVLATANEVRMSTVTDYELRIVLGRYGPALVERYNILVDEIGIVMVDFDQTESLKSHEAYRLFGKGNHPAGLNMGDCVAYALAKRLDAPLLFKGNDFARTDVRRAL
ncbi:MAG: PIN domain-containing protein [Rhodospirillales bacterium]|nr:PIN domain-containing protein [Rhodospirillales bacterium]